MSRKKMRFLSLILAVILVFGLFAAGCSSEDSSEETGEVSEETSEETTEEETAEEDTDEDETGEETEEETEEEEVISAFDYMTLGDYSVITVSSGDLEVSDEDIEEEISDMLENYSDDDTNYSLTDGFVKIFSEEYWGEQIDTVDDLYAYLEDFLYTQNLYTAMVNALIDLQTITGFSDEYDIFYESAESELEYYASYYSVDTDEFAQEYGYEDAEDYISDEAMYYYEVVLLIEYLWEDLDMPEYTDEEFYEEIEAYMVKYEYDDYFELDEFIEYSGEAWLLIYENARCKSDIVMAELEDRVVIE